MQHRTWGRLNRIRTGQGCCALLLHKWKEIDFPLCQCSQTETIDHIVRTCITHKFSGTLSEIHKATYDATGYKIYSNRPVMQFEVQLNLLIF